MIWLVYLFFVAAVFGIIALFDFLLKKILPKPRHAQKGNVVRMPRHSFIFGMFLTVFSVLVLLFVPLSEQKVLWWAAWFVLAMGAFLLVNFFRFGIFFDEDGFTCRTLTGKARSYRYEEIRAQESFLAKSGWNSTLYVADSEVPLTAAMQGVDKFLNRSFFGWCRQKGIDPDTVENNPTLLVFFPPLEDE